MIPNGRRSLSFSEQSWWRSHVDIHNTRQYLMERWKPRSYLPAHNWVLFDSTIFNIIFALAKHCLIYSEIFWRNKCSHCWLSSHKTVEANARPMPYRYSGSCDIDGSVRYFFPYWEYWEPAIIVKKRETPRVLNQCTEESFAKGCNWLIRVLVKTSFCLFFVRFGKLCCFFTNLDVSW